MKNSIKYTGWNHDSVARFCNSRTYEVIDAEKRLKIPTIPYATLEVGDFIVDSGRNVFTWMPPHNYTEGRFNEITTIHVELEYFKPGGKWYGRGSIHVLPTNVTENGYYVQDIFDSVQELIKSGTLPGLADNDAGHSYLSVVVTPDDGYDKLISPIIYT